MLTRWCPKCGRREMIHVGEGVWVCRVCGYEEDE
jgi:ribosomal protein L37AE/L43A